MNCTCLTLLTFEQGLTIASKISGSQLDTKTLSKIHIRSPKCSDSYFFEKVDYESNDHFKKFYVSVNGSSLLIGDVHFFNYSMRGMFFFLRISYGCTLNRTPM